MSTIKDPVYWATAPTEIVLPSHEICLTSLWWNLSVLVGNPVPAGLGDNVLPKASPFNIIRPASGYRKP